MSDTTTEDGILQNGQLFDRNLNAAFPFTEQMLNNPNSIDTVLSESFVEGTPNDGGSMLARTWDEASIDTILSSVFFGVAGTTNLDLPDTLLTVFTVLNGNANDGSSSQTGSGGSAGTYASLTLSLHSSSQGGAAVSFKLGYTLKIAPSNPIWCTDYLFFLNGDITIAAILSLLTAQLGVAVLQLPIFQKQSVTFVLKGASCSVSATADVQQHVEISGSNVSQTLGTGTGGSFAGGLVSETVTLPAAINGAITLTGDGTSATASASAAATASFTSGTNWNAETATKTEGPVSVGATVTPTSIAATPVAAIPSTGLYLTSIQFTPFSYFGRSQIKATVVDFSILP